MYNSKDPFWDSLRLSCVLTYVCVLHFCHVVPDLDFYCFLCRHCCCSAKWKAEDASEKIVREHGAEFGL